LNGKPYTQLLAPKGTYQTISVPLAADTTNEIKLDSAHIFPLTGEKRERAFLVKNLSIAEIGKSDLFTHGWSPSGYTFKPGKIDSDGWVDGHTDLEFPATSQFKTAVIELARFPTRAAYDLHVEIDGKTETRSLSSDQPEIIKVPLSATSSTKLSLSADEHFALTKPDTRSRSYRVINIEFQ
jgi:hypothetical protein